MTEDNITVRDAGRAEAQGGPKGEVVDEDRVGSHRPDGGDRRPCRGEGLPEQVVAAQLGLEAQRRDRTRAGRCEEAPEVVVLAGRLLGSPGRPGVRAAAKDERDALQSGSLHVRRDGRTGRDHDARSLRRPGAGKGKQREEMRRVVRADDKERHAGLDAGRRGGAARRAAS
jgi:hypothetical protein